ATREAAGGQPCVVRFLSPPRQRLGRFCGFLPEVTCLSVFCGPELCLLGHHVKYDTDQTHTSSCLRRREMAGRHCLSEAGWSLYERFSNDV
ncbi:hypothetical protein E4U38_006735, partial [Claviceps purpurea]